jgi:predicted ATPase/DNA-binding SARP family transcriptional activator
VEFRLLGPLEALADDGAPVALGGRRPRAVLALLLLHANEVVSIDRLIDGVWGESPPAKAAGSLQVHVHALRKALGGDRIVTRAPGYVVRVEPDELDVERFERLVASGTPEALREALALWRGPALADIAYEPFAQLEASRLEESRLAALEARIGADLAAGSHAQLVGELDALVASHPHREGLQAQRMLALYRSGRQADALAAYRESRAALDALGLEPSPELRALERRILEHDPALAVAPSHGTSFPAGMDTTLVGRDLELAAVRGLLSRPEVRLVTLTGTGGTGKTRLAHALAEGEANAVFVDLSPLVDARLLLSTIAAALSLGDVSGRELDALAEELTARPRLLVVDNLEQLPDGFGTIAALLEAVPTLEILATSRVPLRLVAEHEYRVPPLGIPGLGVETADRASAADAVRLYVERARAEVPGFELTDTNASAIVRICRALDGLPLAIELAAARVRVLGPEGTAKRLGEQLSLLTRSAPDLPERRRSLRAAIDWSYQLLDDDAGHVLRVLSVFAGGATLDGVEAVAEPGINVPTALEALLDASLVTHHAGPGGEPRFAMLETIRAFAAERLHEAKEDSVARQRHLDFVVALATAAELRAREAQPVALFDEIEADRDNIRAALVEAARDDDPERQLLLVTSLRFFFGVRGPADEARRIVAEALARRSGASPERQGHILISAGIHALDDGDGARALSCLDEAASLLEEDGDTRGAALAHANAATALSHLGDSKGSIVRAERALEGFRAVGATTVVPRVLANLAQSYEQLGDYGQARGYLTESLELQGGDDSEGRAFTLAMLGYMSELEGDLGAAARWTIEAIQIDGRLRKDEYLGYALLFASDLVNRKGDPERAAMLLGASEAAFSRALVVPQAGEASRAERVREILDDALTPSARAAGEAQGAALDHEAVVELAVAALEHGG